jgi:uncharacterized protein YdhG (YjbR/CyaY superfamily)
MLLEPNQRRIMQTDQTAPKSIDEYISRFPPDVQEILEKIRSTIKKAAPEAEETIKYKMPTFMLHGNLVYFAAFKKHIGFFPGSKDVRKKFKELSVYEGNEGAIKFPLNSPIPYDLIEKMVQFRVNENLDRIATKMEIENGDS